MDTKMKDEAKNSANQQALAKQGTLAIVKNWLNNDEIKKKFLDVLGQKSNAFIGSIISLVQSSDRFNDVEPKSILTSAMIAATLSLEINPQLGFAAIIPYGKKATFQIMAKGFIQLAMRTSLYKTMNYNAVFEGDIKYYNRFTGEIEWNHDNQKREKIIGYVAYYRLLTGYEKYLYMTLEEVLAHAKRYSKSFNDKNGFWQTNQDAACKKTVIKLLLSKFGVLSTEMQKAIMADQSVVDDEGNPTEYPDNPVNEINADIEVLKELSPQDWENVSAVIAKIESFSDEKEYSAFIAKNIQKIQSFGGKDTDLLKSVMDTTLEKLSKR